MYDLKRLIGYRFFSFVLFVSFSLSSGCSIIEPRPVAQKGIDEMYPKAILEREKDVKPPGPPPFSEKLEPVTTGLTKETKLYSLIFNKVPLEQIINAITRDTDLNLSIESQIDLAKTVTVHLKRATFEEALDMVIVKGAGYAWKIEGDTLHIQRFEERIYQLDYLDMVGETEIDVGGDLLATSVEDAGVAGKFQVKAKRTAENTDVWAEVQKTLEGFKSESGILRINRTAGIIYMADTPRKVASMVRFLDSLSESLHRQVFIEAKIMEVSLSDDYRYGINWSNLEIDFKSDAGMLPDSLSLSFNRGGAITLSDQSRFNGILDFLRTQGDVTTLSNPHLSVMNRQSALLTVGYQFPFADIEGIDRDPETKLITIGTSIKRAILGLQLGITPQISLNGIVTLHIVPTITRIQGEEKVDIPTSSTEIQSISNPIIDLQELATTVRVRAGESIVLAGLISQIRQLNHEGLPWLGKLPFLGAFFKNIEQSLQNKELVIFITPYMKNVI
jgi:MSHA biogenesis protein MshL